MFGGPAKQQSSKPKQNTLQRHRHTNKIKPLNITDIMRVECSGTGHAVQRDSYVKSPEVALPVPDTERYIAPCRMELNSMRMGGREFISGFVVVLPGSRWVAGGASSGSAATKPLASHSLAFSVCAKCPNQLPSTPTAA